MVDEKDSRLLRVALCIALGAGCVLAASGTLFAGHPAIATPPQTPPPSYAVLSPPAFLLQKKHVTGYYPGVPVPMTQHAYAYGWFGVPCVRPQVTRSNGYRNEYSQYSLR